MNSYLKAVFGLIRRDEILREFAFAGSGNYSNFVNENGSRVQEKCPAAADQAYRHQELTSPRALNAG